MGGSHGVWFLGKGIDVYGSQNGGAVAIQPSCEHQVDLKMKAIC